MRADLADWIALNMVRGIGPRTANQLLDRFGSPAQVFGASRLALETAGLKPETVQELHDSEILEKANAEIERLAGGLREGIALIEQARRRRRIGHRRPTRLTGPGPPTPREHGRDRGGAPGPSRTGGGISNPYIGQLQPDRHTGGAALDAVGPGGARLVRAAEQLSQRGQQARAGGADEEAVERAVARDPGVQLRPRPALRRESAERVVGLCGRAARAGAGRAAHAGAGRAARAGAGRAARAGVAAERSADGPDGRRCVAEGSSPQAAHGLQGEGSAPDADGPHRPAGGGAADGQRPGASSGRGGPVEDRGTGCHRGAAGGSGRSA